MELGTLPSFVPLLLIALLSIVSCAPTKGTFAATGQVNDSRTPSEELLQSYTDFIHNSAISTQRISSQNIKLPRLPVSFESSVTPSPISRSARQSYDTVESYQEETIIIPETKESIDLNPQAPSSAFRQQTQSPRQTQKQLRAKSIDKGDESASSDIETPIIDHEAHTTRESITKTRERAQFNAPNPFRTVQDKSQIESPVAPVPHPETPQEWLHHVAHELAKQRETLTKQYDSQLRTKTIELSMVYIHQNQEAQNAMRLSMDNMRNYYELKIERMKRDVRERYASLAGSNIESEIPDAASEKVDVINELNVESLSITPS
jgi:hypothetical protein